MYAAVPRITPCWVAAILSVGDWDRLAFDPSPANAFAKPKSSTLILPSGVTLMFAGFRSRWIDAARHVQLLRASAICRASLRDSSTGYGTAFQPFGQRVAL